MSEFFRATPADREPKKMMRLSRADVEKRISAGEDFESVDVSGLDLSGLSLSGKNFRGARAENVRLYQKGSEGKDMVTTDISHSDWTNAILVSESSDAIFIRVNAKGARFGYSESLAACRERNHVQYAETGFIPTDDRNALLGFNGSGGNFQKTSWKNVDFGGADYGAYFKSADFQGAVFDGCDLSGIDFSTSNLEAVIFQDPVQLDACCVAAKDAGLVLEAFRLTDHNENQMLAELKKMNDPRRALERLGMIVK